MSTELKKFKVYKCRAIDINFPCIWVYYPEIKDKISPRIVKITRKLPDGSEKSCYVQLRRADATLAAESGKHPLWKDYIKKDIDNKNNFILISEHYRIILGINDSEVIRKINKSAKIDSEKNIYLTISETECPVISWYYKFLLARQHPEVSSWVSLNLGILAFFLGILGFIITICKN